MKRFCHRCKREISHQFTPAKRISSALGFGLDAVYCDDCESRNNTDHEKRVAFVACCGTVVLCALFLVAGLVRIKLAAKPTGKPVLSAALSNSERRESGATNVSARVDRPAVLSNESVLVLSKSDISSKALSYLVRTLPSEFTVDAQSLAELKLAGVDEEVIMAMVAHTVRDENGGRARRSPGQSRPTGVLVVRRGTTALPDYASSTNISQPLGRRAPSAAVSITLPVMDSAQ